MLQRLLTLTVFSSFLTLVPSMAMANAPVRDSFAGAGRSGIAREALFTNPAALATLQGSWAFTYFTKSRMQDLDSGGRNLTAGLYDGESEVLKAGFAYNRESRARSSGDPAAVGGVTYLDRTEWRASLGQMITGSVAGGLTGKYVKRRRGTAETKKFDGDLGVMFPLFKDVFVGATYENIWNIEEAENPTTIGIGAKYGLSEGVGILGDAYRATKGSAKGENSWATGVELAVVSDFYLRGGLFHDEINHTRGKSIGFSWAGPTASFDYTMRVVSTRPRDKDHSFGLSMHL